MKNDLVWTNHNNYSVFQKLVKIFKLLIRHSQIKNTYLWIGFDNLVDHPWSVPRWWRVTFNYNHLNRRQHNSGTSILVINLDAEKKSKICGKIKAADVYSKIYSHIFGVPLKWKGKKCHDKNIQTSLENNPRILSFGVIKRTFCRQGPSY